MHTLSTNDSKGVSSNIDVDIDLKRTNTKKRRLFGAGNRRERRMNSRSVWDIDLFDESIINVVGACRKPVLRAKC